MDDTDVVLRRQARQRLVGEPYDSPRAAVAALGAVQAQEYADAKWMLGQRLQAHSDADVEEAFARGEILRTHVLRPTWHFVTPEDIRWMLRLTAPRVFSQMQTSYRRLGLDEAELKRAHDVVLRALSGGGALTRAELRAELERGNVDAPPQRLGFIMMSAELEELVCSGPPRGKQHTYVLLDERASDGTERMREQAVAELVLRYFTSHGPATIKDLAWWSNLRVADVRAGLEAVEGELETAVAADGTTWYSAPGETPPPRRTGALLLSMYDESVIAYKDLRMVPARSIDFLGNPVCVDGVTVGSWRRKLSAKAASVDVTLLDGEHGVERALQASASRYGRFLGLPVAFTVRRA